MWGHVVSGDIGDRLVVGVCIVGIVYIVDIVVSADIVDSVCIVDIVDIGQWAVQWPPQLWYQYRVE